MLGLVSFRIANMCTLQFKLPPVKCSEVRCMYSIDTVQAWVTGMPEFVNVRYNSTYCKFSTGWRFHLMLSRQKIGWGMGVHA